MLANQCHVGMTVEFGRENGEKTIGKVIRVNPSRAKIELMEQRGIGLGSPIGTVWNVPYSMMKPVNVDGYKAPALEPVRQPSGESDRLILRAIATCYNELSPENLSADGMIGGARLKQRRRVLERKLAGLFQAYGEKVGEMEVINLVRDGGIVA